MFSQSIHPSDITGTPHGLDKKHDSGKESDININRILHIDAGQSIVGVPWHKEEQVVETRAEANPTVLK